MKKKGVLLHCPAEGLYLHDYYTSYSSKANYYWPPTDLVLLSGVLREFELLVIDAIAERLSGDECLGRLRAFAPDFVVFTTGTATWENDFRFMARVKSELGARVIGSGSVFYFEAARFFNRAPFLDAAILDVVSPEIAAYVENPDRPTTALAVRRGDRVVVPAPAEACSDYRIPRPRHDLFPLAANRSPLARRLPFALVVASIGCPFGCRFCVAGAMAYRYRAVDNVMEELEDLRALGVREIMFNDPTFTVSKKRVLDFCGRMVEKGFAFSWVCNAHLATLDEETAAALRKAGCHTLMIGVESGEEDILVASNKKITRAKAVEAFRIARRAKLRTLAYFIIGMPGETRESAQRTIDFARELNPDFASFTVLTPDIGSPLRRESIEKGLLDPEILTFDSTAPPVFSSGGLPIEEIWKLRQRAVRSFYLRPSYLFKKLLGIRSIRDFVILAEQAKAMFLH
jgi:anaerobic magnesium-protoporphyrin IX monomethyl ester cyclase